MFTKVTLVYKMNLNIIAEQIKTIINNWVAVVIITTMGTAISIWYANKYGCWKK